MSGLNGLALLAGALGYIGLTSTVEDLAAPAAGKA